MSKNIVLLSDGTGNSAAKLFRTNVWRIYEALELSTPQQQVACYDDGVGTSGITPLRILGGVCGIGLKRNVLRLYRFLCEHYQPGDRIYAFGFSRGAFTIRVLLGLIHTQGVIIAARGAGGSEGVHGPELDRLTRQAYRAFRCGFNHTGGIVAAARWTRDAVLAAGDRLLRRRGLDDVVRLKVPAIEFVGLWDTVDAYGLPIDELTDGIDQWVWPLSMPDLTPLPFIRKACHALALDDERNTFHPVLWDEAGEAALAEREGRRWPPVSLDDERVSQVWFAGMHANVGGGYADDALALVSLQWVADAAEIHGLRFVPARLTQTLAGRDPLGRVEDSRHGLGGYYRYNPRRIEWLTNGQVHEQGFRLPRRVNGAWTLAPWPVVRTPVTIRRPKIHYSVIERVLGAPDGYAPIVLPPVYDVVTDDGRIIPPEDHAWQTPDANRARAEAQERVWDLVWWRRLVYFTTVGVSVWIASAPIRPGAEAARASLERGVVARLVAAVGDWLPAMAAPWVGHYVGRPYDLVLGLAIVLALALCGRWLKGRITSAMRDVWSDTLDPPIPPPASGGRPAAGWLRRLRLHRWYQGFFAVVRRKLLPTMVGVTALLWLAGGLNRAAFEAASGLGLTCASSSVSLERLAAGEVAERDLASGAFCRATGIEMQAGASYTVRFTPRSARWLDDTIDAPMPEGFSSVDDRLSIVQRAVFLGATPFRRVWTSRWFVPIARIGEDGFDQYPLARQDVTFTARTSGELFLFVNDTIVPVLPRRSPPFVSAGWSAGYGNNEGVVQARVRRIR